jgi:uncharacterized protein YcbK (DUF882 family)
VARGVVSAVVLSGGQGSSPLLYNTHTAERIDVVYRRGGYFSGALAQLDYFLRDHRTGDVRHFDPHLYDILYDLTSSIGHAGGEIDIVCGYRTSSTNESLRAHTNGVAKNSLHIQAEAIDLRMPGIDTLKLRKAALSLRRGGALRHPQGACLGAVPFVPAEFLDSYGKLDIVAATSHL